MVKIKHYSKILLIQINYLDLRWIIINLNRTMLGFNRVKQTIGQLDLLLEKLDECTLLYKSGIRNYLEGNSDEFKRNTEQIMSLREEATNIRRDIQSHLYSHSLMAERRADILQLIGQLDRIINLLYKNLLQYEIEVPFVPSELAIDFLKLVELSSFSVDMMVQASKDYFRAPKSVSDKISRIYYFEKEASHLAQQIKRKVFHELEQLKQSQKIHLRYFTLHVEQIAEESMRGADMLSLMIVRQNV